VALQRVLSQIGPTTASRYAHGKPTLRIIENEPVLATLLDGQCFDFPLCQLHNLCPVTVRVRSGSADPAGRRPTASCGASCQKVA
jgi:hypothetical protein